MSLRMFEHIMHYAEMNVKRIIPLAISLLYVSNPDYAIVEQLSRLSHDNDVELAYGAILGLGFISAGTNNSRVAGLLRQLAEFYTKQADHLFIVRIAQGLNAMGKGLLSLNPYHSDRFLLNKPALGGLLTVLHACCDMKGTILDKYHFILYFLSTAMNPRYLVTMSAENDDPDRPLVNVEKLVKQPVSVRVGQAVETVGQAGRPKTITGFQTHTTPVLLSFRDRAELATTDFKAITNVLEGVTVVRKLKQITEDNSNSTVAKVLAAGGSVAIVVDGVPV